MQLCYMLARLLARLHPPRHLIVGFRKVFLLIGSECGLKMYSSYALPQFSHHSRVAALSASLDWVDLASSELSLARAATRVRVAAAGAVIVADGATFLACLDWVDLAVGEAVLLDPLVWLKVRESLCRSGGMMLTWLTVLSEAVMLTWLVCVRHIG